MGNALHRAGLLCTMILLCHSLAQSEDIQNTAQIEAKEMRERMMNWSRQLGVTCVYCHNLDNFKEDLKGTFKTALRHDQAVKVLQEEVFVDRDKGGALKVKVDCFMCHQGKSQPTYKEPPNLLTK